MRRLVLPSTICAMCGKGSVVGKNRPHSQHGTKKVIKPNLQWMRLNELERVLVCTRCRRTALHKK